MEAEKGWLPWQRAVIPFRISTDALGRKLPYKPSEIVREALIMQFNFNNERHRSVPPAKDEPASLSNLSANAEGNRSRSLLLNIPSVCASFVSRQVCRNGGSVISSERDSRRKNITIRIPRARESVSARGSLKCKGVSLKGGTRSCLKS